MNLAETQFSIQKALEFVGNNSNYQKTRLFIVSFIILLFAILNSQVPIITTHGLAMFFLVISGVGQIICPVYMSLKTITIGLAISVSLSVIFLPFSAFLFALSLVAIGFFGRGFYVSSMLYIYEIGGQQFRSWSYNVIFAAWGIAPLVLAVQKLLRLSESLWIILFVMVPFLVGSYFVLTYWQRSPVNFYVKKQYFQAKEVLNKMAQQNNRPFLPYKLQGQGQAQNQDIFIYKKLSYKDIMARPIIRNMTIPLLCLWVYRQYMYYGSSLMVPELGNQVNQNLIFLSVSETVAILLSQPVKLKIRRVNAFFGFTLLITICCLLSSFTTVGQDCMPQGEMCASKILFRLSAMLIRFSISLMGSVLVNYTLQLYPSNMRSLGFSLCLAIGSFGSLLMPWIVQLFLAVGLSGFIAFSIASLAMNYVITFLQETNGKMRVITVEEMENTAPMISLQGWTRLGFE